MNTIKLKSRFYVIVLGLFALVSLNSCLDNDLSTVSEINQDFSGITSIEVDGAFLEVEYQGETIGKYKLQFTGNHFQLASTLTACLAKDACGIPPEKQKIRLSDIGASTASGCCTPSSNSKCC